MPPAVKTPEIERRYLPLTLSELRMDGEPTQRTLAGYAAVYDSRSQDLGGFVETIRAGAFQSSLQRGIDVRALVNHDNSRILGRTSAGTLQLSSNQKGLRYELTLPDTSYARDLAASIQRGDIRGSSFAFRTIEDAWREELLDGQRIVVRELIEVELHDVSPVTDPAYPATEVGLRSLEQFEQQRSTAQWMPSLQAMLMRTELLKRM